MWANVLSPPLPPDSPRFLRGLITGLFPRTDYADTAAAWASTNAHFSSPEYHFYENTLCVVVEFPRETFNWLMRERNRISCGEYSIVPDLPVENRYPEHFLHLAQGCAEDGPLMVAYTPNDDYGRRDRQVRVKPGRYLAQFYPDLPNEARVEWTSKVEAMRERERMKITDDPQKICTIYRSRDIGSCMDGGHSFSHVSDWPAAVYGKPGDLALAYLGTLDCPSTRCVVWPEKKIHTNLYGCDANRLLNLLRAAGYRRGNFEGARIRKIDAKYGHRPDTALMPYIDGADFAREHGEFFILNHDTGVSVKQTCGYVYVGAIESNETYTCANDDCENVVDVDGDLCSWCEENTFVCDSCGNRYNDDDSYTDDQCGVWYCPACWRDQYVACEDCGVQFHPSDSDLAGYCAHCDDRDDCAECGESCKTDDLDEHGRCEDCPIEDENEDDGDATEVVAEGNQE